MKKVIASVAIVLSAAFLLVFNISTNASGNTGTESTLSNIQALQASATEYTCDASTTTACSITVNGVTLSGSGAAVYIP
jgi:hypothetical protein